MSEDVENATCLLGGETPTHSPKGESTKHNIRPVSLDYPSVLGCRVPTPTGVNSCIRLAGFGHHSAPVVESDKGHTLIFVMIFTC